MKTLLIVITAISILLYGLETMHGAFNYNHDRQQEIIKTILEGE